MASHWEHPVVAGLDKRATNPAGLFGVDMIQNLRERVGEFQSDGSVHGNC